MRVLRRAFDSKGDICAGVLIDFGSRIWDCAFRCGEPPNAHRDFNQPRCIIGSIMIRIILLSFSIVFVAACGLGPDMTRDRIPPSPTPTPWQGEVATDEYLRQGDAAYTAGNYAAAVTPYKNAYDQDQYQKKLEPKALHGLVDKLATSYSKTGDARNARLVLAYGLSKDWGNPMHHYVLAATFGEEGSESEALSHLRRAYKNKNKLGKGETLPDPLTDSSFASMQDSDTFRRAVGAMKRGQVD